LLREISHRSRGIRDAAQMRGGGVEASSVLAGFASSPAFGSRNGDDHPLVLLRSNFLKPSRPGPRGLAVGLGSFFEEGGTMVSSAVQPTVPSPRWSRAFSFVVDRQYRHKREIFRVRREEGLSRCHDGGPRRGGNVP